MSTLVNIVSGMSVANPIGIISLIQPPAGLPSGLTRLHLMRRNQARVAANLVTGAPTGLVETNISGSGAIVYTPTTAHGTDRGAGWVDDGWDLDYSGGLTWMAVARRDPSEMVTILGSQNWSDSGPSAGPYLAITTSGFRIAARVDGGNVICSRSVSGSPTPEEFYLFFGALTVSGGTGTLRAYVPHTEQVTTQTFDATGWAPNLTAGMGINRSTSDFAMATDAVLALVGEAGRAWSNSEMLAAYGLLKPWLAGLGVEIL